MHNHAPEGYECPMCLIAKGIDSDVNRQDHVVYADDEILVYISPKQWPNNPVNVLIIPRIHHENIYNAPDELLAKIYVVAKQVALGVRATFDCTGTTIRQHNEPDGQQSVFHLHMHVHARYPNDNFYKSDPLKNWAKDEERVEYARKLKSCLADLKVAK